MRVMTATAAVAALILCGCGNAHSGRSAIPLTPPAPREELPAQSRPDTQPTSALATQVAPEDDAADAAESPKPPLTVQPSSSTKPQMVDASAIQINDKFLSVEDVLTAARVKLRDLPARTGEDNFRRMVRPVIEEQIRDLINESLVYEEARNRLGDDLDKAVQKEMDEALKDMVAKAGGSKTVLEDRLKQEGTTLERALDEHRRQLVATSYLQDKFQPTIYVNRKMLWDHYQNHLDEFSLPKQVQMQVIAVSTSDFLGDSPGKPGEAELQAARGKAQQQIAKAAEEIKAGQDFAKVVRKYSTDPSKDDDGVWALMAAGSLRQAKLETSAFALKEGQVSDVIEDEDTFYLIKALKVQDASRISFEESQAKVEDSLRRLQYRKLADEYYRKLVKAAVIDQSDDFLPQCVDRAVERYWNKD